MQDFRLGNYEPVVSEVVTAEIEENAPEEVQKQHRWLLGLVSNQLVVDDGVAELANSYVERSILTSKLLRRCAARSAGVRQFC